MATKESVVTVCDRCHKEIYSSSWSRFEIARSRFGIVQAFEMNKLSKPNLRSEDATKVTVIDLCNNCLTELMNWLEAGEEEK